MHKAVHLVFLSIKSALLRKKNYFKHNNMHEMFTDLPTGRHPVLQVVSLYISSDVLSKYVYNFSIHVQATQQQGFFGNKLSQIVCQCLRAMSSAHLDMKERAEKQNV